MLRQQQSVTRFTTEAEYLALSDAVANSVWIKKKIWLMKYLKKDIYYIL